MIVASTEPQLNTPMSISVENKVFVNEDYFVYGHSIDGTRANYSNGYPGCLKGDWCCDSASRCGTTGRHVRTQSSA